MECKQHTQQILTTLRKNKLKATSARLQLLDIFEHAKKPLSVNEIDRKFGIKNADKVTLYRNVEAFLDLGLLKKIRLHGLQSYYELAHGKHHHHLICNRCGAIADISQCGIPNEKSVLKNSGFAKVISHSLEFFGVCMVCNK